MAERVGFEPTVPLLGRMLSKHVDSTTLAPLRTKFSRGGILACGLMPGKLTAGLIANCGSAQLSNDPQPLDRDYFLESYPQFLNLTKKIWERLTASGETVLSEDTE